MSNRTVEAILRLSSKLGSMRAFGQLSGHLDKVDRKAKAFNRSQGMIATGAKNMHSTLLRYAAPAALAYGTKKAFFAFAEVERRMNRIGITAEASFEDTMAAFDDLQGLAKRFALPIDEAVNGLDTLVASGMNLKEAMSFLPSVLLTAQAAGAATEDMANTAQKTASALKIEAASMQRAFDIMLEAGKAGQFEARDIATYIPELANSFASLGYEGEEGLKRLLAVLQTLREDTGSASAAATQAQNIFGKMYTAETAKKFSKFGIDLRKEMEAAKAAGEDALSAFVRLSKEAIAGDLTKLPLLFTDQEFRLGMQSLITSPESLRRFFDILNSAKVDGSAMRAAGRLFDDNQAKIDRMLASLDRMINSIGGAVATPAGGAMDYISDSIDRTAAINRGLDAKGIKGFWAQLWWKMAPGQAALDNMAWQGGERSEEDRRAIEAYGAYGDSRRAAPALPVGGLPVPTPRPSAGPSAAASIVPNVRREQFGPEYDPVEAKLRGGGGMNVLAEAEKRLASGGSEVRRGGEDAGRLIREAAGDLRAAGHDAAAAISRAAAQASRFRPAGDVGRDVVGPDDL